MKTHGAIPADRLNELSELVARHRGTEDLFRFIDSRRLPYEIHPMDEYTIDIVVRLPDGLQLVYDTT